MQSVPRISLPELILEGAQTTSIFGSVNKNLLKDTFLRLSMWCKMS